MSILRDLRRPFPDQFDDEAMDAAERQFIAEREAEDAARDDAQAERAMSPIAIVGRANIVAVKAVIRAMQNRG